MFIIQSAKSKNDFAFPHHRQHSAQQLQVILTFDVDVLSSPLAVHRNQVKLIITRTRLAQLMHHSLYKIALDSQDAAVARYECLSAGRLRPILHSAGTRDLLRGGL
jgi:hypothetical protein